MLKNELINDLPIFFNEDDFALSALLVRQNISVSVQLFYEVDDITQEVYYILVLPTAIANTLLADDEIIIDSVSYFYQNNDIIFDDAGVTRIRVIK